VGQQNNGNPRLRKESLVATYGLAKRGVRYLESHQCNVRGGRVRVTRYRERWKCRDRLIKKRRGNGSEGERYGAGKVTRGRLGREGGGEGLVSVHKRGGRDLGGIGAARLPWEDC